MDIVILITTLRSVVVLNVYPTDCRNSTVYFFPKRTSLLRFTQDV